MICIPWITQRIDLDALYNTITNIYVAQSDVRTYQILVFFREILCQLNRRYEGPMLSVILGFRGFEFRSTIGNAIRLRMQEDN